MWISEINPFVIVWCFLSSSNYLSFIVIKVVFFLVANKKEEEEENNGIVSQ